tara:strand:- start:310 stop:807 length:498 start_codon:yes stop_codon:yes gene_type:complete
MFIGTIYKITGACGKVYIGSTTDFSQRKYQHQRPKEKTNSKLLQTPLQFEIIRTDEYNTIRIMWLVEQYYINIYKCVNNRRAFISKKQRLERIKKYANKYNKKYRENNKEKEKVRIKKYHQNNKDKINKQRATKKITCECGSIVRRDCLARHIITKKHKDKLNLL